jgi:hypothetical protein
MNIFLPKMESSLCDGDLVTIFEPIVSKDDVQCIVKHKLDFDELKLSFNQKNHFNIL